MVLTQIEADALMRMQKVFSTAASITFPAAGARASYEVVSVDRREQFLVDVNRAGQIKLTRCTYQERYRTAIVLARLDVDGPPHENPDGQIVPCPHLHLYREGYGTKWAVPAPAPLAANTTDLVQTFRDFLAYCNVSGPEAVQGSLI